jgi:outer membrane lipoprotein SlyB
MRNVVYAVAVLATLLAGQSIAKPVEIDTPDAHIVIVRPLDQWDQNNSVVGGQYISNFLKKRYAFQLLGTDSETKERVRDGVQEKAKFLGFTEATERPFTQATFYFELGKNMTGQQANEYSVLQNLVWQYRTIEKWKKNEAIAASTTVSEGGVWSAIADGLFGGIGGIAVGKTVGKIVGGGLGSALANGGTAAIGAEAGVTIGASTTQSPGEYIPKNSEDVQKLLDDKRYGFNQVPTLDYTKYQSVDVARIVISNGNTGSIFIAYKKPKTPELAESLMIQVIPSAMSLDESSAEFSLSQRQNQKERTELIEKCEAIKKC